MNIFTLNKYLVLVDMEFISVKEYAATHGLAERTIKKYCVQGKMPGTQLIGKTWSIPADAPLPLRKMSKGSPLLYALREQMDCRLKGGIYHRTQIDLTYYSNHIEGSRLTKEQTRYIFETNTIGVTDEVIKVDAIKVDVIKVDDIIETSNHFRCIDFIIEYADEPLTANMIKNLHWLLKVGTLDVNRSWFAVGEYKQLPNEVGGKETIAPEMVASAIQALLKEYGSKEAVAFEDILDFHYQFEAIHPFQDRNGRVGRLIMFKECLPHGIVPFIITDELKMFYYRGLEQWEQTRGYLIDTCLTAQDQYKALLDYFRIKY